MSTKTGMGFFVFFIGLFYAVGLGLLGFGLWSAWRSNQAASWPTVPGTLTNIDLKSNSDDEGTAYQVKVEYTYSVAGKEYQGSRLAFGYAGSGGDGAHAEILEKLEAAKSIDVRYDPADPATSALSFGMHRSIQFVLGFAITWLAFIVGFTILWWLGSRNDSVLLENLSVH